MALRLFETPVGKLEISYLIEGGAAAPKVVVLHGWGANKELMRNAFSRYFGAFRTLYLDLPGFGASQSDRAMDTKDYAAVMQAVLSELDFAPAAAIGHSFGGKVAALLDPPLLVILSASGIPAPKPLSVKLKIALAKKFKFFSSSALRDRLRTKDARGLNEAMYETLKKVVDEDFSGFYAARSKPTLIFWGINDRATPLFCGQKMSELIKGSEFFALSGDHFFFTSHAEEIAKKIAEKLEAK